MCHRTTTETRLYDVVFEPVGTETPVIVYFCTSSRFPGLRKGSVREENAFPCCRDCFDGRAVSFWTKGRVWIQSLRGNHSYASTSV